MCQEEAFETEFEALATLSQKRLVTLCFQASVEREAAIFPLPGSEEGPSAGAHGHGGRAGPEVPPRAVAACGVRAVRLRRGGRGGLAGVHGLLPLHQVFPCPAP